MKTNFTQCLFLEITEEKNMLLLLQTKDGMCTATTAPGSTSVTTILHTLVYAASRVACLPPEQEAQHGISQFPSQG